MKTFKHVVLTLALFVSFTALADSIYLQQPGYGGNGCPAGSASVTLSPDAKSLSVIFDQFMVNAGGMTGKRIDRKSCDIAIPVHVPNGLAISIIKVDYRGFNSLPSGASSKFTSEYFFAGTTGPKFIKDFKGPLDRDYLLNNQLSLSSTIWSPCGKDVNLRVNSSMLVQTNSSYEDTFATVDSADFNAGILYHLQIKSCL